MKDLTVFIRRFAWKYKGSFLLCVLFNVLTAFFTIFSFAFLIPILQMLFGLSTAHYEFIPWSEGSLKNTVINNFYYYTTSLITDHGPSYTLMVLAAILVGMTLLKTGTYYLSEFFIIPLRNGVVRDMRSDMYAKIVSLPIGFFTTRRKGDIIARISGDVAEVEASVLSSILSIIRYPIMIIFCLAVMIYISWQLTLFVFIILPVFAAVMGAIGKKLKATSLKMQQIWGGILSTVEESIGGLRVIKAFNAERQMDRHFRRQTSDYYDICNRINRRIVLAHPVSETLGTLAIAILLWFGGTLILSGNAQIDAAEFIYYMVIFYSIINPAKELSKAGYTIQKGMAALSRIDAILDARNPIADPPRPVELSRADAAPADIQFKNVSFSYDGGETDVLRDISLHVHPGQTVAIVGESGSGKSTLVDMVPRFWDVSAGEVLVDGVNVKDYRVKDLRSLMGIVNQEAILFNDTIFNNIALGCPGATEEEVIRAAKIANAHDFIMQTEDGYSTIVGDRGSRLSGGQRQRISIARAVLKNPPLLILDEATSALDTQSERHVQEALERLMSGRTTIVIAHRLSTITNADKICVLHQGHIVEAGSHNELIDLKGRYYRLVKLQST